MPALSPTMTQGTIAEWVKKEGEAIKAGDVIAKVETDKATVDFEAQDEGVLAKILVPAPAADVACGRPVAVVVEDAKDVAAFADFKVEGAAAAPAAAAPAPAPKPAAAPAPAPAPAPKAAAAPAPAPAPAPAAKPAAAPAPAPAAAAPGDEAPYLAWPAWGQSLNRSPIGQGVLAKQKAYTAAFGLTGQEME